MALTFFVRDGTFTALILLVIVEISAQQPGGRCANRNHVITTPFELLLLVSCRDQVNYGFENAQNNIFQ